MFLKQQQQYTQHPNGKKLMWGRADRSMAPFRGNEAPLLKEHEYEDAVQRVWDCKFAIFDAGDPSQKVNGVSYQEVMDNMMSGWWHLLKRRHRWHKLPDGQVTMLVYIEWAEPYDEPDPNYLQRVL